MKHILVAVLALAALPAHADAITDLVGKSQREVAAMSDGLKPSDRAECYSRAVGAGGSIERQQRVELSCREAARLRRQGR